MTMASFDQQATNFPGDFMRQQLPKPVQDKARHHVGEKNFSGSIGSATFLISPRRSGRHASSRPDRRGGGLLESVSSLSLETSVGGGGLPPRPKTPGLAQSASATGLFRPSSVGWPAEQPSTLIPGGTTPLTPTRSLNNLSDSRSSPGLKAWGKSSKGTGARSQVQSSSHMDLAPCKSQLYWVAQRGQLTERSRINERELTKDSPLLKQPPRAKGSRGGGAQARAASQPTYISPLTERMPVTLVVPRVQEEDSAAARAASAAPGPATPAAALEKRRAGWNERFYHGSPVLDGSRRWPDAGRVFVRNAV